jgi:hypothetical protein
MSTRIADAGPASPRRRRAAALRACAARYFRRDVGVDAVHNKGVYDFKRGTGAREVRYLGEWDAARPAPVRAVARRMIRRQRPS